MTVFIKDDAPTRAYCPVTFIKGNKTFTINGYNTALLKREIEAALGPSNPQKNQVENTSHILWEDGWIPLAASTQQIEGNIYHFALLHQPGEIDADGYKSRPCLTYIHIEGPARRNPSNRIVGGFRADPPFTAIDTGELLHMRAVKAALTAWYRSPDVNEVYRKARKAQSDFTNLLIQESHKRRARNPLPKESTPISEILAQLPPNADICAHDQITWADTQDPPVDRVVDYADRYGEITERQVAVKHFSGTHANGHQYMGVFEDGHFKTFRLDRILKMTPQS